MPNTVHLWADEIFHGPNRLVRNVRAEYFDDSRLNTSRSFVFDIESEDKLDSIVTLDFAVLVVLFGAMRWGRDIVAQGPLSDSLLRNLEEFQQVWCAWQPQIYRPVGISGAGYGRRVSGTDCAVAAFSGGVDACFTAYRHLKKRPGKYHYDLATLMLVQGFDIPFGADDAFAIAVQRARAIVGNDAAIATVKTDVSKMLVQWQNNFGAALAACLHQFAPTHSIGLVGSDEPYQHLALPWGSNPISNPFLSSDLMKIVTDGSGYTRTQKVSHVANWQAATENLRVCWEGPVSGKNCGRCEKCIRTILNFRAADAPFPAAFAQDVTDAQIRAVTLRVDVQVDYMRDILEQAEKNGIDASWVDAVRNLIDAYKAPVTVTA